MTNFQLQDNISPIDSALHTFVSSTSAITSTISKVTNLKIFNVLDYSATGNGSTDDTNAIQATINAAENTGGGIVYFPPGSYKFTDLIITLNYIWLKGAGYGATKLIRNKATGNGITIGDDTYGREGIRISDMSLDPSVTQLSGAQIYCKNISNAYFENLHIFSPYDGIGLVRVGSAPTSTIHVDKCLIAGAANDGIAIGAGGSTSAFINDVYISKSNISYCVNAIHPVCVGALYVDHVDMLNSSGSAVLLNPASGQCITDASFIACCFDLGATGFQIANSGLVGEIRLIGCWAGTNSQNGILINNVNANGITISDSNIVYNGLNGILISAGKKISITGCKIWDNSVSSSGTYHGIYANGISGFIITDNMSGQGGWRELTSAPSTQGYGVKTGTGANNYTIVNNHFIGNVSGGLQDTANGANKIITPNLTY